MSEAVGKIDFLAADIAANDAADSGWPEAVKALEGQECEGGFEPLFERAEELKRKGGLGPPSDVFPLTEACLYPERTEPNANPITSG